MKAYHGTPKKFEKFDITKTGYNSTIFGKELIKRHGIFFTPDIHIANGYAGDTGYIIEADLTMNHPFNMANGISEKMEDDFHNNGGSLRWLYNHQQPWEKFDDVDGKLFIDILSKAGYDSAIISEDSPHNNMNHISYIVFNPKQIHINNIQESKMIKESQEQQLHTITLSDYQKQVLAKAVMAGSIDSPSKVALGDEKLTTARDMLDELDIIDYSHQDDTIKINDEKLEFLKQEGIIDDSQQLTQEMQELLNPNGNNATMATESFIKFLEFEQCPD
jgi:hypothetical protein